MMKTKENSICGPTALLACKMALYALDAMDYLLVDECSWMTIYAEDTIVDGSRAAGKRD